MEAKLYLFCIKKNEENAVFSHLTLASSVADVIKRFDADLRYLIDKSNSDLSVEQVKELSSILNYFSDCSLWCLGSIDFVSGVLIPCIEEHDKLINVLEVLKDESI